MQLEISTHFSYSQAKTILACPEQWRLSRQTGDRTSSVAAEEGSEMDDILNAAYRGDTFAATNMEVLRDAMAILQYAPHSRGTPQVELHMVVEGIPVDVLGFADLVPDYGDCVVDHKRGGGWDREWWHEAEKQIALYANALGKSKGRVMQVRDGIVHIHDFEVTPELVGEVHDMLRKAWYLGPGYLPSHQSSPATPGKACCWCDYERTCPQSVFKHWGPREHAEILE